MNLSIPTVRFDNRTEYDALHFDTLDQNGVAYHVFAAKVGFTFGPAGPDGFAELIKTEAPSPLHAADVYHDDDIEKSVRYESDLAPYKPACDVIVLGSAHAPGQRATRRFDVALHVQLPDVLAPIPEKPLPLNPMQAASVAARQEWEAEVERAKRAATPGRYVISKVLTVTGPRQLKQCSIVSRSLFAVTRLATLGLVRPPCWRLTTEAPATTVVLRFENAQGGSCQVDDASPAAARVPNKHRLAPDVAAAWRSAGSAPVAVDACDANPVGRGYAPSWYLKAAKITQLPAPQIEYRDAEFSSRKFDQCSAGRARLVPAGFGFVGRAWLPRRSYVGSFDTTKQWGEDEVPQLPQDFDFRYWNGAPEDQQCTYLVGGERFTLVNMFAGDGASVSIDPDGNSLLRFRVPSEALFLLGATSHGEIATTRLSIDTAVIDSDARTLDLTFRACLLADGTLEEVRLLSAVSDDQLARLEEWDSATDSDPPHPAFAPITAS